MLKFTAITTAAAYVCMPTTVMPIIIVTLPLYGHQADVKTIIGGIVWARLFKKADRLKLVLWTLSVVFRLLRKKPQKSSSMSRLDAEPYRVRCVKCVLYFVHYLLKWHTRISTLYREKSTRKDFHNIIIIMADQRVTVKKHYCGFYWHHFRFE